MSHKKIKVLSFDLDDTLWECLPVINKAELTLRKWLESYYPNITQQYSPQQLIENRAAIAIQKPEYSFDFSYIRKTQLYNIAIDCGYDKNTAEKVRQRGFEVFITERSNVVLYDDVIPAFTILKQHFSLGALTNGNVDLTQTELNNFFDFSLNATTAGYAKPDPRFFQRACELAKADYSEIIHIGDHPIHDINGALSVGIETIWLNRNKSNWPDLPKPNNTISSLNELPGLLLDR